MIDNSGNAPALILLGTLEIGGSETKFVSLARRLYKSGLPVHVAYLRGPEDLLPRLSGVPHVHLEQQGKWSLTAYRALRDYVSRHEIGSIVTVNPYPLIYAAVGSFGKDSPVRVIASINTSEFLACKEQLLMLLYKRLLRRCDHVVFGSMRQRELWTTRYGLDASESSVIYNAVDSSYFAPEGVDMDKATIRRELGIPNDSVVIVCVGQLRPEKGHGLLLEALVSVGERCGSVPHLILVGDGAERQNIINKIKELNLESCVHLTGSTNDVRPYLKAADIFALTSIAVETFSNAALEAASMGLPIVMSDIGGAREMFSESGDCIIYDKDDRQGLANSLEAIVKRVRERRESTNCLRDEVLERYTMEKMNSNWCNVLWQRP